MNTYLRKIKKNSKALSPVVASIILIAVTVAVSVVVAAWMGGMTIGLMGNAEQAQITNVALTNDDTNSLAQAVVSVRNTGSSTVTISSQTIDGHTATVAATSITGWVLNDPVVVDKGTTVSVTITVPYAQLQFVDGAQYNINLLTAKGTTVTYTATFSSP